MRKVKPLLIAAAALAAAVGLTGCNSIPSVVGSQIAARLPAILGPADHYDASVGGSIFDLARGKIAWVHIHGQNIALSPQVHIADFTADASDIHADTHTQAIKSVGSTRFEAVLNQFDMDNYLSSARPIQYTKGVRIVIGKSALACTGSVGFSILSAPFSVTGTLAPVAGAPACLNFVPSNASFAHIKVPQGLVQAAVSQINPIVDLSKIAYPVAIKTARVDNGRLIIDGTVNLSSLIGTNPAAPVKS